MSSQWCVWSKFVHIFQKWYTEIAVIGCTISQWLTLLLDYIILLIFVCCNQKVFNAHFNMGNECWSSSTMNPLTGKQFKQCCYCIVRIELDPQVLAAHTLESLCIITKKVLFNSVGSHIIFLFRKILDPLLILATVYSPSTHTIGRPVLITLYIEQVRRKCLSWRW